MEPDASIEPIPSSPSSLEEEPTSNAELNFRFEYQQCKGSVAVKLPGQRAALLLNILLVFGIVTSAPLLFWAAQVTLTAEQVLAVLGFQFLALVLCGALGSRERQNNL